MSNSIPRRFLEELISRWTLTGIQTLIVEGEVDSRFFKLLKQESHCEPAFGEVDCLAITGIEVPTSLAMEHGLESSGEKQRVVALLRAIEKQAHTGGFRGVLDRDLDEFLAVDFSSEGIIYTDHSCMELYLWSPDALRRICILFGCEDSLPSASARKKLFDSMNEVCRMLTAVRLVNAKRPELQIKLHNSDASLDFASGRLTFDLEKYVGQCKPSKGMLEETREHVRKALKTIQESNSFDVINGHDLVWLLEYAFKQLAKKNRKQVSEESVFQSLVSFGVMNSAIWGEPLFQALTRWACTVPTV